MVFVALTVVNIFLVYWLFPETAGLSLEEIGAKFGDEVVVQLTTLTSEERDLLDQKIDGKSASETHHIEA